LLFFGEAFCDVDLIDLLELLLSFSFGFEDISKFLFVPSFNMGFDMLKFLLEHVHFCALNIQILSPPFINVILKLGCENHAMSNLKGLFLGMPIKVTSRCTGQ